MKSYSFLGALLVGGLTVGLLSSCQSSTYYPQEKDQKAYRDKHGGLKDQVADDQAAILQSHTDARQGLNLPPDQQGVANDGAGWSIYR